MAKGGRLTSWMLLALGMFTLRQFQLLVQQPLGLVNSHEPPPSVPEQALPRHSPLSPDDDQREPEPLSNLTTTQVDSLLERRKEPNRLLYIGQFGLGHRLSKFSAAYHLALTLNVSHMDMDFGYCEDGHRRIEVFAYLFGNNRWSLRAGNDEDWQDKSIVVRNDVLGYAAGQSYKNAQWPISKEWTDQWLAKLGVDYRLFQTLLSRMVFQSEVQAFYDDLQAYTVIGLHLRAGNGEQEHFTQARRVEADHTFVNNVVELILGRLLPSMELDRTVSKPPIVFLATDTPKLIGIVKNATEALYGVSTVVFPQQRLADGAGVSYTRHQGSECLNGWRESMIDMALLAAADIVVAGMRSTFTQILPLSIVLPAEPDDLYRYCEVSEQADRMSCFRSRASWLLRHDDQSQTFALGSNADPVVHKVMVHLPDPQPPVRNHVADAVEFLSDPETSGVFVYGPRFLERYRNRSWTFQTEWTWARHGSETG